MTTVADISLAGVSAGPAGPRPASSLGAAVLGAAARHRGVALQFTQDGRPAYVTYSELGSIAEEIARGLIGLGVAPGDRIAILGLTSATWTMADCGALCAGAVVAPIYHTNSPGECAYVLSHSGAKVVFCADRAQVAKIEQVREQCPALEHIVRFGDGNGDGDRDGDREDAGAAGTGEVIALDELRRRGASVPPQAVTDRLASIGPEDLATLVYTSGTTGPPKGCMLTHGNLLAAIRIYAERLGLGESHSLYQFLPLAHVLARVAQFVVLTAGARIIYWRGDPTTIIEELGETAPTHFPAVPRIYEKVHGEVLGRLAAGSAVQRALFRWALRCGTRCRADLRAHTLPSLIDDAQFRLADRLVLARVRSAFGPRLQLAMVGAAPVARELLEFFDACGVLVVEGYGMSESCAASTLNTVEAVSFGTVGRPLPGTEIAIAPDGEILIHGPQVFTGYFRDEAATQEALTGDGWLRSGDLGSIDAGGFLTITGRKKDLIITSSGKNISPANVETALRESRYFTEAVVFGDNRPYLVAMLTLDHDEAARMAARLAIEPDPATLAAHPGARAEIQAEIDRVNAAFARIEQVKRFAILDHDLAQTAGELTPTLKVKRAVVYERYGELFASLYDAADG